MGFGDTIGNVVATAGVVGLIGFAGYTYTSYSSVSDKTRTFLFDEQGNEEVEAGTRPLLISPHP
jgi:hypothetical protein